MKIISSLILILTSTLAFAELTTTIIPNVDRSKLESALRETMDVHRVSITTMKEHKFENTLDDILSIFNPSLGDTRSYIFTMTVDESVFNKKEHTVICDVMDNLKTDDLLFLNCESKTSSVSNMLFSKQELRTN